LEKVGYGILGVGKLTSKTLIPAFQFCEHSKLVALGSRNPEKAQLKVRGAEDVFCGSYEEVIAHPQVQVVYVVLPNHLHAEWSIKAMELGKAVLCEKPICTSGQELDKMRSVSQKTGQLLAEAFMYRFHPQHQKVLEILSSGVLGELQLFKAQFSYQLNDPNNIRLKADCYGGALMDVGCYLLDALLRLSGSEISTFHIDQKSSPHGTDQNSAIQVKMNSGLLAQLFCSTSSPRANFYHWIGERGSLEVPQAFIPASGKQVNLILKTEAGQQVIKIPGVNQYALQIDGFSEKVLKKENFVKKDPLYLNGSLHKALDLLKQAAQTMDA
jgi:predicted dehydrogenase